MPLTPSRTNRDEGEAGEIYDAPPRREPAQRYPSAAGSYASLALDPPSHLQPRCLNTSNSSDGNRGRGGRVVVPRGGGRGREGPPGRFGGRYGTNEESQHRPPPPSSFHSSRPEHGISGEFSSAGLPPQRGAPVLARGRGFPPGGRFPARGQATGRWVGGRERVEQNDALHEPVTTFSSSGFPVPRGGRGSFPPRGGSMDGRGRGYNPRGGGFEGRGRPIPSRGMVMNGRGFPSTERGAFEGRGPPPPISHRPPPDFAAKRTYSDMGNETPHQTANFPDHKRIRTNPSFGSEGEIVPQKQQEPPPHYPPAYRAPPHHIPPGPPSEKFNSFPARGPPLQDGGLPRPRYNFPPGPTPMHPPTHPTFRPPDRGGSLPLDRNDTHMDDQHSMDRATRGPVNGNNRPGYNDAGASGDSEASFENRAMNHAYDRSHHLNSARGDGISKGPPPPPPPESDLDHAGPPRASSWGALNNHSNNNRGPPPGTVGQGMGEPPQEAQRQFPPPSFGRRQQLLPETERGGFIRGGPGRGFFPGRGDVGRGRATRAREIIAGRGGDILGGRGPPAPPPPLFSTYDEYGNRPPLEHGGGRGRGRGGGGRVAPTQLPQTSSFEGWPSRPIPSSQTEESNNDKTISPRLPPTPPPPEPTKPDAPEPAEPSAYVTALIRLADLEAQMEYEFAKHMHLLNKHKELKAQYEVLEDLPVGLDAIKDDLARLENKASA